MTDLRHLSDDDLQRELWDAQQVHAWRVAEVQRSADRLDAIREEQDRREREKVHATDTTSA